MNVKTLSQQEIDNYLLISDIDDRRNLIQNHAVDILSYTKKVIFSWATGSGKTYLAIKAIQRCSKVFGGNYVVVVPDSRLYDSWIKDLKGIPNCFVYVVNTFTMSNKVVLPDNIQMIIFDEGHHYLNENSMFFSSAISKKDAPYKVILSATLTEEHLEYAKKLGFNFMYNLPLKTAYKLQMITDYKFFNIGVDFTENEKVQYVKFMKEYKNHLKVFEEYLTQNFPEFSLNLAAFLAASILKPVDEKIKWFKKETKEGIETNISQVYTSKQLCSLIIHNTYVNYNISEGYLIFKAKEWYKYMSKRNQLYHKAQAKVELGHKLLTLVENQKAFLICQSKDLVQKYIKLSPTTRLAYHSGIKQSKKILDKFKQNDNFHLIAIKKIDEGDLDNKLSIGIKTYHDSKTIKTTQQMGRLIRLDKENPDKKGRLICIYVKSFSFDGIIYESQDLKWLSNSQKKQAFIEWVEDLEDLKLFL